MMFVEVQIFRGKESAYVAMGMGDKYCEGMGV